MNTKLMASANISKSFQQVCNAEANAVQAKMASPFSIRLSVEERAFLEQQAGHQPLGAYIRAQLFGDKADKRRVLRKPKINEKQVASVLAALGHSRMSANLNQLAKHANMGTLDISRDVEQELQDACAAIFAMRDVLYMALGQRPPNTKESLS